MTQPGRSSLLAVLLHERFHQSHDWFTTPKWVDESNNDRIDELRRRRILEAALDVHDVDGVSDQNSEVA